MNKVVPFLIYGPAHRWAGIDCDYRGGIPAEGVSVLDKIRESGIALCIHSKELCRWNLLSMRVVLNQPEECAVETIARHVRWINEHPREAMAMAREAHASCNRHLALENALAPAALHQSFTRNAHGRRCSQKAKYHPTTARKSASDKVD